MKECLGGENIGLITYMRTDSINLSQDAIASIREHIQKTYGADEIPETPRVFKTKSKNAQEAHEAIRPTDISLQPKNRAAHLSADQLKLYELIYKRTLASQMVHATLDTAAIDLNCGDGNTFRATGSTIKTQGLWQFISREKMIQKKMTKMIAKKNSFLKWKLEN